MSEQRFMVLDYETRSEADLRAVGAFEYSMHPTTQILCAAWRIGTKAELLKAPTRIWSPAFEAKNGEFGELLRSLLDPTIALVAHNALFEQVITRNVFSKSMYSKPALRTIPHDRWICTAARASALALPRKLEMACIALGLDVQKDMEGAKLLLKYCKPRRPTKNNPAKWHSSSADLRRLMEYCATDVGAETELFLKTPSLNRLEREIWKLDQKINFRGVLCDRKLVAEALKMVQVETHELNKEASELTKGRVMAATQRDAMLREIRQAGFDIPDLRAKTVSDAVAGGTIDGKARRLLEIRQSVSKSSTAKYEAFWNRSGTDGRVRDTLLYWGASTGRWAGMGLQPQNFPRGTLKNTDLTAELIRAGDLETLRLLYGNPMEVLSSTLRAAIIAPEGRTLFCADYAAIEARVLFWVARHEHGLDAFREGRDLYREMATVIFRKQLDNVEKSDRQVGKQAILGCGYGMGGTKFQATCANYSIDVSEEIADRAVKAYRSTHSLVPELWRNLEKASIAATQSPGRRYTINRTTWFVERDFLWCELPSGRRLAYYKPSVQFKETPWGEKRPALYHWAVNPKTKQWERTGTWGGVLTENVVQAISRDLMAEAMLRIESAGYDVTLTVHDELVAERDLGKGSLKEFESLMAAIPAWAEGCPVKVEGWTGPRYHK